MGIREHLAKSDNQDGHWITINGRHIFVRNSSHRKYKTEYNRGNNPTQGGARHEVPEENRERGHDIHRPERTHQRRETDVGGGRQKSRAAALRGNEGSRNVRREIRGSLGSLRLGNITAPVRRTIRTQSYPVHEVEGYAGAAAFREALVAAKRTQPYGAAVDVHAINDYRKCRLFVTPRGEAGIAVEPDGNIISVFKNRALVDPSKDTASRDMLLVAIRHGGNHLDCFGTDEFLPRLYSKVGFEPVAKVRFDREFAPPGWNYARDGEPDIVFMRHNGDSIKTILETRESGGYPPPDLSRVPYVADYDEGARRAKLNKSQNPRRGHGPSAFFLSFMDPGRGGRSMPSNVVKTPADERHWAEAKRQAAREGHADDWAYIQGIFQRIEAHSGSHAPVKKSFRTDDLHPHGGVPTDRVYAYLRENYPPAVLTWVKRAEWHFQPKVRLSDIQMDRRPGGRNPAKVTAIAEAVKKREPMEPVILVDTGDGKFRIADGYHRTLAHKHAGEHTIRAIVGIGVGEHGPWDRAMHDAKLNKARSSDARIEALAEAIHNMWMGWAVHAAESVDAQTKKRWASMFQPYDNLPESEKAKDRVEAIGVLDAVKSRGSRRALPDLRKAFVVDIPEHDMEKVADAFRAYGLRPYFDGHRYDILHVPMKGTGVDIHRDMPHVYQMTIRGEYADAMDTALGILFNEFKVVPRGVDFGPDQKPLYEDARKSHAVLGLMGLRKATDQSAGQHWVTIKKDGPLHGRHLLLDDDGRIRGGAVPKFFHGKPISEIHGKHLRRHWKEHAAMIHATETHLRKLEREIGPLAKEYARMQRESQGPSLQQRIRHVTGGHLISSHPRHVGDLTGEFRETIPSHLKRKMGGVPIDQVAESLDMSVSDLLEGLRTPQAAQRTLREFTELARQDVLRGDEYRMMRQYLDALKEEAGAYRGPAPHRRKTVAKSHTDVGRHPNGRFVPKDHPDAWQGDVHRWRKQMGRAGLIGPKPEIEKAHEEDRDPDGLDTAGQTTPASPPRPFPFDVPNRTTAPTSMSASRAKHTDQRANGDRDLMPAERMQIRERFGDHPGCSFARDAQGIYAYTQRARSKSYPHVLAMPKDQVRFVASTG